MYKVMLVDDEPWSVKGLKKILPWLELGFEVTSLETDSVVALEHLIDFPPDVVFTDIRMPEISGLELLQRAREKNPALLFVIISGHNDFEYAQKALRLGAIDYVLKPIDIDEGKKLLERLRSRLEMNRREADRAVYALLLGEEQEARTFLAERGIDTDAAGWMVIVFASSNEEIPDEMILHISKMPDSVVLHPETGKVVLLLHGLINGSEIEMNIRSCALRIPGIHIGLSNQGRSVADIPHLLIQAELASGEYFLGRMARVVPFSAAPSQDLEKLFMEISSALVSYNYIRVSLLIDRLPIIVRREKLGVYHVELFWNRLCSLMEEWKIDTAKEIASRHLDGTAIVKRFRDIENFCAYMKRLVGRGVTESQLRNTCTGRVNPRFLDLLDFVNENYAKKLSLAALAMKYQLNKSYCCELFSKFTNGTFTDYITELRMKKAWHLLHSGECDTSEVAEMVGYADYFYFSRVFKRYFQIPPTHMRTKTKEAASDGQE